MKQIRRLWGRSFSGSTGSHSGEGNFSETNPHQSPSLKKQTPGPFFLSLCIPAARSLTTGMTFEKVLTVSYLGPPGGDFQNVNFLAIASIF